jgi:hypothetical protein
MKNSRLVVGAIMVFSLCVIQCTSDKKENSNVVHVDVSKIGSKNLEDLISTYSLLPLGAVDSLQLIGQISKIQVWDEKVYVFDRTSQSIFAFTKDGKSVFKIKNFGEGPGEYTILMNFSISASSGSLYAFDAGKQKMLVFDARSGKFLREKKALPFACFSFEALNDNYFVFYQGKSEGRKSTDDNMYEAIATDSTFQRITGKYFHYESGTSGGYLPFPAVQQFGAGLDVLPHYEQSIYKIRPGEEPKLEYTLDLGNYNLDYKPLVTNPKYTRSHEWIDRPNPDWIYFFGFMQSKSNAVFHFDINKKKHVVVLDKDSGQSDFSFNKINNNILAFSGVPLGYSPAEDTFIAFIEPSKVVRNLADEKYKSHPWLKKLKTQLSNLKESDNPILIFYKYAKS